MYIKPLAYRERQIRRLRRRKLCAKRKPEILRGQLLAAKAFFPKQKPVYQLAY
jgi:hypothetical protein